MNKIKRLLSALMSCVIIAGSLSVAASAAHSPYLDGAVTDKYNTIDRVELTTAQKASLLLDKLDVMLEDEDIYIDIPLIGAIDLRSTDSALSSIYSITGNWLYGSLTVGDLVILETHRGDIASVRRTTTGSTDVDVINSLADYIGNCAPTLVNIIDDSLNWGMVKGFLPPDFRIIIDDFPKYIKETIWEALHPVNTEAYPSNTTLDGIVQFMCDNQLGGKRESVMGFSGVLPGFTLELTTDNGYRAFEEAIYCALNRYVVPLINNELKTVIRDAVTYNSQSGGSLDELVNVDYVVTEYTFDRTKGLMEQVNDMLKSVVDQMLIPGKFTWNATGTNADYISVLSDNIRRLIIKIAQTGGETEDISGKQLKGLGDYLARISVEQFVKHMSVPENAQMHEIAYLGLREFLVEIMPERSYPETPADTSYEGYRNAIIEMGADIGAFYLNNAVGLNCSVDTTADQFLSAVMEWLIPYADGLFDRNAYNEADTGWGKVNAVIWEFIPKEWLNYAEMFEENNVAGTAEALTFQSLVNYLLDAVFNFDLNAIDILFGHSASSTLDTLTARQTVINLIVNILNGAFSTDTSLCVPSTMVIDEFEDILNPLSNLKTIASNVLVSLKNKKDTIIPTAINLVTLFMGAADEQSLGEAKLDIDSRIYCENGAVPSGQTIRISNLSEGVNRAYRNAQGALVQDKMYEIEVVSLTTDTAGLSVAAIPSNTKIAANGHYDVAVSGTVSANTEARFDLEYYILDENGTRLNTVPLITSVYAHFYKDTGNYEAVSPAVGETNRVSFEPFSTYLYTTDIYDAALFSILATNNGVLIGNDARDIRRAVITGTLPTGISANNPESGAILSIDEASLTVDAYGTVNPYSADIDPDAAQPYGIYDLDIQFDVCSKGADTGTRTEARDHIIVVYNDFGLPGLIERVMNANRQRADYAADADAEWTAYRNALSAGYALIHGNPDHTKMFANVTAPDGSENAYAAAVAALNAAVTALDAKVKPTDAALLAALKTTVETQTGGTDGYFDDADYKLFTYDRWNKWKRHANRLINSQTVPEGTAVPSIAAFDLIYAKHMLDLMYPRMIRKAAVKTHLAQAITAAGTKTQSDYAADTWADYSEALSFANSVNNDTSADLRQSKVNDARIQLMKTERRLKPNALAPAEGSTTVIDSRNMVIYGISAASSSLADFVTVADNYTVQTEMSGVCIGTGTFVKVYDTSSKQVALYTVILFGDFDGNGNIEVADADAIYDYLSGQSGYNLISGTPSFRAADVNRDGVIDTADVSLIEDYLDGTAEISQTAA